MSSAFRNFLITFCACLIVFGLIGWKLVYPAISDVINPDDTISTQSEDVSNDTSENDIGDEITKIIKGDTFTAVIVGKANDGLTASVIYFRINETTKRFSYCYIPTSVMVGNSVGRDVPLKNIAATLSGDEIARKVSAITGIKIDYYAILGMDELIAIVDKLNNAYIEISSEIKYINPDYVDEIEMLESGSEKPEEYYIKVQQGRNIFNKDLVKHLMNYSPYPAGIEYHIMSKQLYEAVFTQFFTNSGTKNNNAALIDLLNDVHQTNITPEVIETYMKIFFAYDQPKQVNYPNERTENISKFKQADGTE